MCTDIRCYFYGANRYGVGSVVGSKWDVPLPSVNAKDLSSASNFPSAAGGRSSFIRNARYAPGVNPSSVPTPLPTSPSPTLPTFPCSSAPLPLQVSPTPGISAVGAFGVKASAAAGMRNDTLDSIMQRNSQLPAASFGMRPSFGQGGGGVGSQLPSVQPQSGFGNKCPPPLPPPHTPHLICLGASHARASRGFDPFGRRRY